MYYPILFYFCPGVFIIYNCMYELNLAYHTFYSVYLMAEECKAVPARDEEALWSYFL